MRLSTPARVTLYAAAFLVALIGTSALLPAPPAATPEEIVAALPGVGAGWLDTLRRVAGPVAIDTISPLEAFDECCDLLGLFERWHMLISINPHMTAYARFVRNAAAPRPWAGWFGPSYTHPLTMVHPAGVVAHEFGHRFQFGARPHAVPMPGDTLPRYARDAMDERFADRFARAMLALRGWDDPDPRDAQLNHRVRYLLIASYWPAGTNEAVRPPAPAAPADGTSTHAHKYEKVFTTHPDF